MQIEKVEKKRFFNRSLTSMIVSSCFFLTIIPIVVICIYAYLHLAGNIKRDYNNTVNQVISGIDKNLDIYFTEIRKTTDGVFATEAVQELLKEANATGKINDEYEREVRNYIYDTYGGRGDISCVGVYSMKELVCEKNLAALKKMYPEVQEVLKELEDAGGAFTVLGARYQISGRGYHRNIITVGRMIKDLNNGSNLGFLVIDIDYGMFKKMLAMSKNSTIGTLVIVNKRNEIIYNSTNDSDVLQDYTSSEGYLDNQKKKGFQDVTIPSLKIGWTYHMLSDGEEILKELNTVARQTIVLGMASFLSLLLIALTISKNVTKPIKRLDKAMERAEETNFNEIIPTYSTLGEINHLIRRYNVMQVEIKRLLEREKQLHKKQAETEYKALQMQITPHFLYNALDTINCLAQINNQPEISEMIIGLGNIFKYNIKYDFTLVTLQDEINHVKNYGLLQAIRYQDSFEIRYEVEEKYLEHKVTKFMLQPLIENAISHGMKDMESGGIIRISAGETDEYFQVMVEDNGIGMEAKAAKRLQELLNRSSEEIFQDHGETGGIGIANVNLRLKLQYGEKAGITFDTEYEKGTIITICIPKEV